MITKNIISLSYKNSFVYFALIAIIVISIFIFSDSKSKICYQKLQGSYNMIFDSTVIIRDKYVMPLDNILTISKSNIELPVFVDILRASKNISNYDLTKSAENSNGKWEIISNNPDSILIKVSSHPLSGKFALKFKKIEYNHKTLYCIFLDNDSTHLCLSKYIWYKRDKSFLNKWNQ